MTGTASKKMLSEVAILASLANFEAAKGPSLRRTRFLLDMRKQFVAD